jgi:hypothetical protein
MSRDRLIYALKCPITNEVHYIGKTEKGLTRPFQHLKDSHNDKIREWVKDLSIIDHRPVVDVIEYIEDHIDIDAREYYYIQKYTNDGHKLLNYVLISPVVIKSNLEELLEDRHMEWVEELSEVIRERRKNLNLHQDRISDLAGIALTVVRKIEQKKTNFVFSKLVELLNILGLELQVVPKKTKKKY